MPPADRHDTDDLVVRAALGEPLTDAEQERLDEDPGLREEVAQMAEIVTLAQDAPEQVAPARTLEHLWDGIAAEAFGEPRPRAAGGPGVDAGGVGHGDPVGDVVPLRRRTTVWGGLAAVAAAAAAVVALVTVGPLGTGDDARPVAAADLEPIGDVEVPPVEARFVVADDSALLRVDLSDLPDTPDGFYEVWLLDPDDGRLVSLGPARPDGEYALPAGTGVDDFPAVDVSVEPHDGDPGHSGASVLRGPVRAQA